MQRPSSFSRFYEKYLNEHRATVTRVIHFLSVLLLIWVVCYVILSGKERFLWYLPIFGLLFPSLSHAVFEKRTSLFFQNPLYDILSDFVFSLQVLTRKQNLGVSSLIKNRKGPKL